MSGIAYDLKKIKGFVFDMDGVLSPSSIPIGDDGNPVRMANVKDGYVLQLAVKLGYPVAIISGGNDIKVRLRFEKLGISDIFLGVSDKLPVFQKWMKDHDLKASETIYMGDDIPDLKCMRIAGLPCAPYDASREVLQTALYVSKFSGGYGCVRDVVEQTLRTHGQWLNEQHAHSW